MKKFLITALALVAGVSVAMAGMGISWGDGGGWMVEFGGDIDEGPGIADNNDALWQLIYAGADGVANDIDLSNANYLSGDDELLADRSIPAGGGTASDGTSWDGWLMQQGGNTLYEDLTWNRGSGSVYQRIFQINPEVGVPVNGDHYYQTDLFTFNGAYEGGGQASDIFGYSNQEGLAVDQTIPGGVPEPATMSLLGLGALAMVLRRKLRK